MDTKDGAIQLSSEEDLPEELPPESEEESPRKKAEKDESESEIEDIPLGDVSQKQGLQVTIHNVNNYFPMQKCFVRTGVFEDETLLIDEVKVPMSWDC